MIKDRILYIVRGGIQVSAWRSWSRHSGLFRAEVIGLHGYQGLLLFESRRTRASGEWEEGISAHATGPL